MSKRLGAALAPSVNQLAPRAARKLHPPLHTARRAAFTTRTEPYTSWAQRVDSFMPVAAVESGSGSFAEQLR